MPSAVAEPASRDAVASSIEHRAAADAAHRASEPADDRRLAAQLAEIDVALSSSTSTSVGRRDRLADEAAVQDLGARRQRRLDRRARRPPRRTSSLTTSPGACATICSRSTSHAVGAGGAVDRRATCRRSRRCSRRRCSAGVLGRAARRCTPGPTQAAPLPMSSISMPRNAGLLGSRRRARAIAASTQTTKRAEPAHARETA